MSWIGWALLSAVFAAMTAVLAKIGVENVDANLATAARTSVVVVFTWLLAYVTRQPQGLAQLTPRSWLFLTLSGIATGSSWLCYFHALKIGEASRVAPLDKLSVVFVIPIAAVFLGERVTWSKGVGALLILAGALVLVFDL